MGREREVRKGGRGGKRKGGKGRGRERRGREREVEFPHLFKNVVKNVGGSGAPLWVRVGECFILK